MPIRDHACSCTTLLSMVMVAAATTPVGAQFTDEANARGLMYRPTDVASTYGSGVAFVDLNNDGFADIVCLGDGDGIVGIFENNGTGHFIDHSATSGIAPLIAASGVCAGDYNNDGLLDVYITRVAQPNALLRNDGAFTFTDIASALGVDDDGWGQGCTWCDFDGDQRADLAVANYDGANILYRNKSDNDFNDVTELVGAATESDHTFQVALFDYDLDALVDLFVVNDAQGGGCGQGENYLLRNTGGKFLDVSEVSGADLCMDSMCLTVGDIDRNGWPDVFITNTGLGSAMLCSNGAGAFHLCGESSGVTDPGAWGWGSVMFDHNHDGWLDLYVCRLGPANRLFEGTAQWPMQDVGPQMNLDTDGLSFTVATADIDHDGDLDLLLSNWAQPLKLFINNHEGSESWAQFDIRGIGAQPQGIGARIDARTGSIWQQRHVIAGAAYKSQNELTQHFGFGEATIIDELIVTWLGGQTRTFTNVPVNARWSIIPPDKLGDANEDGLVLFEDFLVFDDCIGSTDPGCEVMDFDGDWSINLVDLPDLLGRFDEPLADCNDNGIADLQEIIAGTAADLDGDWLIDACGLIPGDVTGDGAVDLADLLLVISTWGPCEACDPANCPGDANADCGVDLADLLIVISNWGASAG